MRRLQRRLRRRDLRCSPASTPRAATASAWTATLSLYDTAMGLLTYPATLAPQRRLRRRCAPRHSAHPSLVPFQAFEAKDGWMVDRLRQGEVLAARCAVVIERAGVGRRPARSRRFADRDRNRDVLIPLLEEIFAQRTVAEWVEPLQAAAVPTARINDVAAALTEPHTIARDLLVETEHPRYGTVRQVASPVRVGDRAADVPPGAAAQRGRRPDPRRDARLRRRRGRRPRATGVPSGT